MRPSAAAAGGAPGGDEPDEADEPDEGDELDELDVGWLHAKPGVKWARYGAEVLPAWVADMDFPVPPVVRRALVAAVEGGDLGYPSWHGGTPLRAAFAERMVERYRWAADPAKVRELTDVVQGFQLSLHLASSPGDAVALQTPAYPPFLASITEMGRRLVAVPMEDTAGGWRFDPDRAEAAIAGAGCKVLVVVNPHNPTGRVLDRGELEALAGIAERHDLVVVTDEIHAELAFPPARHVPFASLGPEAARRTITLTSATKAFNLAGIRCALAHVGPDAVRAAWDGAPSHLYGQPGNLSVLATLAAWRDGGPWAGAVLGRLRARRDEVVARLAAEAPAARLHPPEGTYLAWIDLSAYGLGDDPAAAVLAAGRVALGHGPDFGPGGQGFARLNFATSPAVLSGVLDRLVGALAGRDGPGR